MVDQHGAAMRLAQVIVATMFAVAAAGCKTHNPSRQPTTLAATNSYLHAAVADLGGQDLQVALLAPSGGCPGHFDIRPSQIERLRSCRLLLRFGFQRRLDEKLAGLCDDGLTIQPITLRGGLCLPQTYLAACRQVADALAAAGLIDRQAAGLRLASIERRLAATAERIKAQLRQAGLTGQAVLASRHQADFCRWLGLALAGTFGGSDSAGFSDINSAVEAGRQRHVQIVIANKPEGRALADALADRLGAAVVVFDNFPKVPSEADAFDQLLLDNVSHLLEKTPR